MTDLIRWIWCLLFLCSTFFVTAQGQIELQFVDGEDGSPVATEVWVDPAGVLFTTGKDGYLEIPFREAYEHAMTYAHGYATKRIVLKELASSKLHRIELEGLQGTFHTVEVYGRLASRFEMQPMRKIEGTSIFAARKSEQLLMDSVLERVSTTNTRSLFGSIAGLHIWENSDEGLQLNVGTRGLNPSRSAHFNTRQNGYDISADALGYPEAYYTPILHAVDKIQIVGGAGALQYGTQFGGLLEFKMKEGSYDTPLQYESAQTLGSFGLLESFHSLSGGTERLALYSAYQYKRSDGWRDHSGFDQHNVFASLSWRPMEGLDLAADFSYMKYKAQLPGGLTDADFRSDPGQSLRSRNYFRVQWLLTAVRGRLVTGTHSEIDLDLFHLDAMREALGDLTPVHRADPMEERKLISGLYDNWGLELRYRQGYSFRDLPSNFVFGLRLYNGLTRNEQGFADQGSDADFELLHPAEPEQYSYRYPGMNAALFAEHVWNVSERLTVTSGVRWEYLETNAEGYYRENIFIADSLYHFKKYRQEKQNIRRFPLFGAGMSYQLSKETEGYGNITQNFRSINFGDLTAYNPNVVIDSTLGDESGFSLELGLRGRAWDGSTRFDLTAFWMNYKSRIGLVNRRLEDDVFGYRSVAYRTNVGHARILGLEGTWQHIWIGGGNDPRGWSLSTTLTAHVIRSTYIDGVSGVVGNKVEYVPPYTGSLVLELSGSRWECSLQYKMVGGHFSDATNAEEVVHATTGRIPGYQILDAGLHFKWEPVRISLFIHNVLDEQYFTRRATAYPGPGIIPAAPRKFSLRLQFVMGGAE